MSEIKNDDGDTGAGIRTGAQYLEGLQDSRDVWREGEKVEDVTKHPGLSRGAHTLASFMDKQFDPEYRDIVTYREDDKDIPMSFLIPKSKEDIVRRGAAFYEWAKCYKK